MKWDRQNGRSGSVEGPPGSERGLSSVVGIVLLIGLVSIASVGILLAGGSATEESRDRAKVERVELAFREFDSRIASVGRGSDNRRVFEFDLPPGSNGAVRESNAGQLVVERYNLSTGATEVLVNQSLGAVVYQNGGTSIAYQAGAVWRGTGRDARMVSRPPFSYATTELGTQPTLTLPLVTTTGDRRISSGDVQLSEAGVVAPLNDVTVVEGDLIIVSIKSEYYGGWAEYFRQAAGDSNVIVDHANQTTTVEMVVPSRAPAVEGGVILGAAQESLKLKQYSVVDSYNSSAGDYASTQANQTKVLAAGDVIMKQDTTIEGDLVVGGDLTLQQDSRIDGDLRHAESTTITNASPLSVHVDGSISEGASVDDRTAVDGVIDRNLAIIREHEDNANESHISGQSLVGCSTGSGCNLSSGTYLLDQIALDTDETLVLNTTGGPISIAVLGKIDLDNGTIRVVGPGRANVYLDSETGSEDFAMKGDATVSVPDERSVQFWMYTDSDAEVKLRQSADYTGVIYGPGPSGGTGTEIRMSTNTDRIHVYGAVVGDIEPITQEVKIHYDEALATSTPIQTALAVPRLTFLHVSVYRVSVEDD